MTLMMEFGPYNMYPDDWTGGSNDYPLLTHDYANGPAWAFVDESSAALNIQWRLHNYDGSSGCTVYWYWGCNVESSGDVEWGFRMGNRTPNSGDVWADTAFYGSFLTPTDSHLTGNPERIHVLSQAYTHAQMSSPSAGDLMSGAITSRSGTTIDTSASQILLYKFMIEWEE